VEQAYREVWQRYSLALRQRNAALRAQQAPAEIRAWDAELLDMAEAMHRFRSTYIESLKHHLVEEIERLLPGAEISVSYQPGWPANTALTEVLAQALEKDRARGHTRFGPHRADFSLLFDAHSASTHCSRGQQKALIVGFLLAQVKQQRACEAPMGAFLLDDLSSELDAEHRARILGALRELDTQVFVTAIDDSAIVATGWQDARKFHVEQGHIREVQ